MTLSFKSPFYMLAYFYEIQMSFPESASKTVSHIQSTAKYIFLRRTPYATFLVVRQNCLKVSILSSKKNEYSVDRWAWLESTSWWWICQIWIEKMEKKLRKKILLHIHFWCEIDQKQFMNERRSSSRLSKKGGCRPIPSKHIMSRCTS